MTTQFTVEDANTYVVLILIGLIMLCIGLGIMFGAGWFFIGLAVVLGGFGIIGLLMYHAQKKVESNDNSDLPNE